MKDPDRQYGRLFFDVINIVVFIDYFEVSIPLR